MNKFPSRTRFVSLVDLRIQKFVNKFDTRINRETYSSFFLGK